MVIVVFFMEKAVLFQYEFFVKMPSSSRDSNSEKIVR